jgi:putative ABC transport system permease protein
MLLWEFTRPVLLANIIAWPAAYHFLSGWMHGFAYHVDLGIGLFVAVGLGAIAITMLTVFSCMRC